MTTDFARLEEFVLDRMGRTKLAAVSIGLVEGDALIWQRGFGLADREAGRAATPRTSYCIGSVTKSFTCLAIMQLQEAGLLSVDDPVERFLPLTLKPFGEPIRIRHLMSHTSGIPALAYLENLLRHHHGAADKYLPIGSVADMLTFINGAADWVQSRPGERWFYLNEGYVLLGAIIEQVSGRPYADYIRERILQPLGMARSYHSHESFRADDDTAVPYIYSQKESKHLAREYPWGRAEADGGLISNVPDMACALSLYLRGGLGPSGPIITPASVAAMTSAQVATPPREIDSGEPASFYGFGLSSSTLFGRRAVAHSGLMYVATAALKFLPEQRCGVIVLANGSGYPLANVADFALALYLGEDPWQLPALQTEATLEALTGTYETYKGTYGTTVRRKGDFLALEFSNKHGEESVVLIPERLDPERPGFYTLSGGRRMAVEFRRQGDEVELLYERYKFRRTGKLPTA